MRQILLLVILLSLFGCATVSDNVITAIDEEQYRQLNDIYSSILEFRFNNNKQSLNTAKTKLDIINLDEIYNSDFKAKVLGLKSLTHFYLKNRISAKINLENLKSLTEDEELYWIVSALLEKDKKIRLNILLEGNDKTHETLFLDDYLAESLLENEQYGESAAVYDLILLTETPFKKEYKSKRDMAFLFLQNPPNSYESGQIAVKDAVYIDDLLNILSLETTYFDAFEKNSLYDILTDRGFFNNNVVDTKNQLLRRDMAYFLFALIADRNKSLELWPRYRDFFISNIDMESKMELEGMSPITDTAIYEYYFYPVLYLIEEEIMELPDGENFFPEKSVSGRLLHSVIGNLKKRVE